MNDDELLQRWPGIRLDRDNAAYFRGLAEGRLLLNHCRPCGAWHHPPRPVCPRCWSQDIVAVEVSGAGRIDLLTFLHQGRPGPGIDYEAGHPVCGIGLVEQPGVRVTATVVGADRADLVVGAPVELDWEHYDGGPTPVFRLAGAGR